MTTKLIPHLTGVPETMLWTLHNRATEARRRHPILRDEEALRIYEALDYDYRRRFGPAEGSHAVRSVETDRIIRAWLVRYPDGFVVSLGEGLETQVLRVDNGRMRWLSVDLPEAIALRAQFLPPTDRFRHIAVSALDHAWMDEVDPRHGVFIIAQGLFMYLPETEVRRLLRDLGNRFPGCEIVFDTVPRWFSRATLRGVKRTRHYRVPPMPWGIDRNQIAPTLKAWGVASQVTVHPYRLLRGLPWLVDTVMTALPGLRNKLQAIVHARLEKPIITDS